MANQATAWQLTINNPKDHDMSHENIKAILEKWKAVHYWCMCDEIGLKDQTYHTHLYINTCSASKITFKTIKNKFPKAHIEPCIKGSPQQNRDYIRKEGRYKGSAKEETNLSETFEEYGDLPPDSQQGKRTDLNDLYEMIKEGRSTYEILEDNPQNMRFIEKIERTRYIIKQQEFRNVFRSLSVTYIYGRAGAGKTRSVMDRYGYENVYRITDYHHPFDAYQGQDVIIFEEFRSSLKIGDMLNYLDGYPLDLPCRYNNKIACYTKVYIISNLRLEDQYTDLQRDYKETWQAFLRRIHWVEHFTDGECKRMSLKEALEYSEFVQVSEAEEMELHQLGFL